VEWGSTGLVHPGHTAELRDQLGLEVAALVAVELSRKANHIEKAVI